MTHRRIDRRFEISEVVIQPTGFCNLDCSYCYIAQAIRNDRRSIGDDVVGSIVSGLEALTAESDRPIGVLWHAGEPLTVGADRFRSLLAPFERLRARGSVRHNIQTNGTLIDAGWCDLFGEFDVGVGVSIDGPAHLNGLRVTRGGAPSFDRAMRGVRHLNDRAIPFGAISVISLDGITGGAGVAAFARDLYDFFAGLGCKNWGINVEEREAANATREVPDDDRVTEFYYHLYRRWMADRSIEIRELRRSAEWMATLRSGADTPERHGLIPTVDHAGNVVLLSPELLGMKAERYDDFVVGNVRKEPLMDILARAHEVGYVRDFLEGARNCRATCPLGSVCRAGSTASSKFSEHGDLKRTETAYCRNGFIRPGLAVLSAWREDVDLQAGLPATGVA